MMDGNGAPPNYQPIHELRVFPYLSQSIHSLSEANTAWHACPADGTTPTAPRVVLEDNYPSSYQTELDAYQKWRTLVEDPHGDVYEVGSSPSQTWLPCEDIEQAHGSALPSPSVSVLDIDPHANFLMGKEAVFNLESVPGLRNNQVPLVVTKMKNSSVDNFASVWRPPTQAPARGRRKRRVEEMEVAVPANRDPWHFWSEATSVVNWGRKEEVQETMADRALGVQLSRHLVDVYFLVVHLSYPVSVGRVMV